MENLRLFLFSCIFILVICEDENTLVSMQTCGNQVLDGETGTINFVGEDSSLGNVRCTWIIRTPNSTGYKLQLNHVMHPDHKLTVIGDDEFSQRRLTTLSPYHVSSNVVLVTFHSGESSFGTRENLSVSYEPFQGGISKASLASRDVFLSAYSGLEKHPRGNGQYGQNEVSFFVLPPYDHVFDPSVLVDVTLKISSLGETYCNTTFTTFSLNPRQASGSEWEVMENICVFTNESYTKTSRDIMLFIFVNKHANIRGSFELSYERRQIGQSFV